jgi:hypothetical protein
MTAATDLLAVVERHRDEAAHELDQAKRDWHAADQTMRAPGAAGAHRRAREQRDNAQRRWDDALARVTVLSEVLDEVRQAVNPMTAVTEVRTVDVDEALALLQRAVDEVGADYVDPIAAANGPGSCMYVYNTATWGGCGNCLIGKALTYLGVDVAGLISGVVMLAPKGILRERGVDLTPDALPAWAAAQRAQDRSATWGQALAAAHEAAGR